MQLGTPLIVICPCEACKPACNNQCGPLFKLV